MANLDEKSSEVKTVPGATMRPENNSVPLFSRKPWALTAAISAAFSFAIFITPICIQMLLI